jgi:serine protease Do
MRAGRTLALAAVVSMLGPATPSRVRAESLAPLVERLRPGVVNVQASGGSARTLGSGFVVDGRGLVVTNAHVVAGAEELKVVLADRRTVTARLVGADAASDVALLRLDETRGLLALPLGDSDRLRVGDAVIAIGNPFGLGTTVTAGIVSAKDRHIGEGAYDDLIQTDAPINPGSSGGPLFDENGAVVGISSAMLEGGRGIGFAIPINSARAVLEQLRKHGRVVRGWIGVEVQDVTPELAPLFRATALHGALVAQVAPDGPAAQAGLRTGDVLLAWGGQPLESSSRLVRRVAEAPPGTRAPVRFLRDGATRTAELTVARERPGAAAARAGSDDDERPAAKRPRPEGLGLRVVRGAGATGVVVAEVDPDGPAATSIEPGDIILDVDRMPVRSSDQLRQAVARHARGTPVLLRVKRGDRVVFVALGA